MEGNQIPIEQSPKIEKSFLWVWIVVGVVILLLIGGGIYLINYSNSINILNSTVDVQSNRAESQNIIDKLYTNIEITNNLTLIGQVHLDMCDPDSKTIEASDSIEKNCEIMVTNFYGFDGDFREKILAFEDSLFELGWENFYIDRPRETQAISESILQYYDKYYGPTKPNPANFRDGYLVSNIPKGGYLFNPIRNENNFYVEGPRMALNYAEEGSRLSTFLNNQAVYFEKYKDEFDSDLEKAFNETLSIYRYMLAISIKNNYVLKIEKTKSVSAEFNDFEDANWIARAQLKTRDKDSDGLSDYDEIVVHGTNWLKSDTDEDGYSDGEEIASGLDPRDNLKNLTNRPAFDFGDIEIEPVNIQCEINAVPGDTFRISGNDFANNSDVAIEMITIESNGANPYLKNGG
jgi:uncharacterized protein (DUF934 family)